MNFRITDDGDARDIHEIYELLKAYNLSRREASQNVPIGVFLEDEAGRQFDPEMAPLFVRLVREGTILVKADDDPAKEPDKDSRK